LTNSSKGLVIATLKQEEKILSVLKQWGKKIYPEPEASEAYCNLIAAGMAKVPAEVTEC
jgi:hypothetical protein